MAVAVSGLITSLRREVDPQISYDDSFTADGSTYAYYVINKPVVTSTVSVFVNHVTYTSGVDQALASGVASMAAAFHYDVNLNRGQVLLYSGVYPNGVAFMPWNGSVIKIFYDATDYTDQVLAGYIANAVPKVESQLNLGYKFVDISPSGANLEDNVGYHDIGGVDPNQIGIVPEPIELVQTLINKEASLLVMNRERRIGVKRNQGVVIRDGDIEINASNTYRASESSIKDLQAELKQMYADIKLNMDSGIGIKQLNEQFMFGGPLINYEDPDYFRRVT